MGIYDGHVFGHLKEPIDGGVAWKAVYVYTKHAWVSWDLHMDHWGGEKRYMWLMKRWASFDGRRYVLCFNSKVVGEGADRHQEIEIFSVDRSVNSTNRFHSLEWCGNKVDPVAIYHIVMFVEQIYTNRITSPPPPAYSILYPEP